MNSFEEILKIFLLYIRTIDDKEHLVQILRSNEIIVPSFDEGYLDTYYKEKLIVKNIEDAYHSKFVYVEGLNEGAYRIIIKKASIWQVYSFEFMCYICFGDDDKCETCGGTGWGVI